MSEVVNSSANGPCAPEVQVLSKLPATDCGCHPRATRGPVLDATARIKVHVEYSDKKSAKATCSNIESSGGEQNIKPCVQDHVWSQETCARHGCKECCGCVAQQSQCDKCAEDNVFVLGKKIHDATLHDWHPIEPSEGDGYIESDIEVVTHDMVASFEQENFEIVDGVVETELVDGRIVKVWKDTMLMEDCGFQCPPKSLVSLWLGN